jgi:hypothetical protein
MEVEFIEDENISRFTGLVASRSSPFSRKVPSGRAEAGEITIRPSLQRVYRTDVARKH